MPALKTGHMTERIADVLKACRRDFVSVRDVAEFCGYKKADYARVLCKKLAEHGLLETRMVKGTFGNPTRQEYRVDRAWRDE